jgi:hypothetical protein
MHIRSSEAPGSSRIRGEIGFKNFAQPRPSPTITISRERTDVWAASLRTGHQQPLFCLASCYKLYVSINVRETISLHLVVPCPKLILPPSPSISELALTCLYLPTTFLLQSEDARMEVDVDMAIWRGGGSDGLICVLDHPSLLFVFGCHQI